MPISNSGVIKINDITIMTQMTIKEYLDGRGIEFKESNGELVTKCLFNSCDNDSKGTEAHLYFDANTGQYNCKKCGTSGNLATLQKHFGEMPGSIPTPFKIERGPKFDPGLVYKCQEGMAEPIRKYLNSRGITDEIIDKYKLGYGKFYGKQWITIPIADKEGNYIFFKLRQDPGQGSDKITYPKGIEAQIYGWETLQETPDKLIVCEGEFDRLLLISKE